MGLCISASSSEWSWKDTMLGRHLLVRRGITAVFAGSEGATLSMNDHDCLRLQCLKRYILVWSLWNEMNYKFSQQDQ